MKRYFLFIATLLCLFTSQSYADQHYAKDCVGKGILGQLCSYGDSSITGVQGEKYYLDLERICVCENGMYLNSDFFGLVPVFNLIQDDVGVYTLGMYSYYMCTGCGRCYNSRPSSCGRCGGTSFTLIDNTDD